MADSESFSFIEKTARPGPHHLFDDLVELTSAKSADHDLQYVSVLREHNPGMILTCTPANNVSLLTFAAAGFATYELDRETDSFASWRGYYPPQARSQKGSLAEAVDFAKYHYKWNNEDVGRSVFANPSPLAKLPLLVHPLYRRRLHSVYPQGVPGWRAPIGTLESHR